jgi:hypothetical protein
MKRTQLSRGAFVAPFNGTSERCHLKATIVSHAPVPDGDSGEIHRFGFVLEDNGGMSPYTGTISLRTARVLVARLEDGHAFIGMLRAIVTTVTVDYDSLIGRQFDDHF